MHPETQPPPDTFQAPVSQPVPTAALSAFNPGWPLRILRIMLRGLELLLLPLAWLTGSLRIRPAWLPPFRPHRARFSPQWLPPGAAILHLWLHGASVGELGLVRPLLKALEERGLVISPQLTAFTPGGLEAARRLELGPAWRLPLDLPGAMRQLLNQLRPQALVLLEAEFWPIMLYTCLEAQVPVLVVNGRLSDRSVPAYRRFSPIFRPLLSQLRVLARSSADAARFRALGVPPHQVVVGGDLKSLPEASAGSSQHPPVVVAADIQRLEDKSNSWESLAHLLPIWRGERPLLVLASLHPGELPLLVPDLRRLLDRWPRLCLLLAPRHPNRLSPDTCREILPAATPHGPGPDPILRRSDLSLAAASEARGRILWLDTLGELRQAYPAASGVVVCGSFGPVGGHNLLEVAREGCPCAFGPHVENVLEQALVLEAAGAGTRLSEAGALERWFSRLLEDPAEAQRQGEAGRHVVHGLEQQLRQGLDTLAGWLEPLITPRGAP